MSWNLGLSVDMLIWSNLVNVRLGCLRNMTVISQSGFSIMNTPSSCYDVLLCWVWCYVFIKQQWWNFCVNSKYAIISPSCGRSLGFTSCDSLWFLHAAKDDSKKYPMQLSAFFTEFWVITPSVKIIFPIVICRYDRSDRERFWS